MKRAAASWRHAAALIVALALASCATAPRARDEGGPAWFTARGPHLTVDTDLGAEDAARLVTKLENWRVALAAAVLPGARPPVQRLHVVVLRNSEFEALMPLLGGMHRDEPYVGPYLILGGVDDQNRESIMRHEMTHAIVAANLHDVPRWLNEGLAKYLETMTLDDESGDIKWGAFYGGYLGAYRSFDQLMGVWPRDRDGVFEHSAAVLVHMLERRHPAELGCLLRGLANLEQYDRALARCAPNRASWGWEYSHEFFETGGTLGRSHIELYRGTAPAARLTDADVHALLALLDRFAVDWVDPDRRPGLEAAFVRHRQRALALDPVNLLAASLKLTSDDSDGDPRGELTARLLAAHPNDWRAWLWRADMTSTPPAEKKAALARVAAMAPDRPEVVQLQAYDAFESGDFAAAERFARREMAISRWYSNGRMLVFTALEHMGRCADVRAFLASDSAIEREVMDYIAEEGDDFERPVHCVDPPGRAASR
jgi:hypothetical protein